MPSLTLQLELMEKLPQRDPALFRRIVFLCWHTPLATSPNADVVWQDIAPLWLFAVHRENSAFRMYYEKEIRLQEVNEEMAGPSPAPSGMQSSDLAGQYNNVEFAYEISSKL